MRFIHKTNQYLIERFPTVWNTKIVWMILISIPIHFLFFLMGLNTELPTDFYAFEIKYYTSGWSFFGSIISTLMLIGWVVAMFKNNAFKNFYPMSNTQLFGQFLSYFVIIFCSISFYLSCAYGFYTGSQNEVVTKVFSEFNYTYIWRAFGFAALIFSFRVTNLRTLLFALVSLCVLGLIVGLFTLVYSLSTFDNSAYFSMYFALIIGTIILFIPIFMPRLGSKLFRGILLNMSILGFVPYIFLVLGIISMHQKDACISQIDCQSLLDKLGFANTSWLLLIIGFVFIFAYIPIIKRWRALPE